MTRSQALAHKLRFILLVLAAGCFAVWAWWVLLAPFVIEGASIGGTPAMGFVLFLQTEHPLPAILLFTGLVLLAQWMLLRPRRCWTLRLVERGRPMKTQAIGAAFFAMLLTTGFVLSLFELRGWWMQESPVLFWVVSGFSLLIWAVWAGVFWVYWKQDDRYSQLGRMIRGLLAGSVAEMLVATGIYAWNPQNQDEFYCGRGSYTGLVFGGTVMAWVFGPGVVLLFLREKHRRLTVQHLCSACGYDLRGTIGHSTACPECGAAIRQAQHAKK